MNLRETELECIDCMYPVQDSNQWQALVNTVNERLVSIKGRGFLTS